MLAGYVLYYFFIQTHALWQGPTLIADRWKQIFNPVSNLFPEQWIRLYRGSDLGYVAVALYFLLLALLFVPFLIAVRKGFKPGAFTTEQKKPALRRILIFTILALAVLMIVPGTLSSDLFSYIWYGRIFVVFGDNPMTHVPADYAWKDVGNWLQWTYWKETASVYGPVWAMIAGFIAAVAQSLGGDITNHIMGHKLAASLAHLANIVLIWKVAGLVIERYWDRPKKLPSGVKVEDWRAGAQIAATLIYAWNPLTMLEFGANGHNDVLMLTGVLAAILLYLKGKWRWAMVAFGAAAMVKFIAMIFVPGFLWLIFWEAAPGGMFQSLPRRIWRLAQAGTILGATLILAYIPFWDGPQTVKALVSGPPFELYVNSLGWLARYKIPEAVHNVALLFSSNPGDFWSTDAVGRRLDWPVRYGADMIMLAVAFIQTWRARTFPRMVVAWSWVLFVYVTLASVWFWPWYVSWLLVPVALVGPGRLLNATLILSGTTMLLYGTYWRSNPVVAEVETWKPLLFFVPPLAYLGIAAWRDATLMQRIRDLIPVPLLPAAGETRRSPARQPAVRVPATPQLAHRFAAAEPDEYAHHGTQESLAAGEHMDY